MEAYNHMSKVSSTIDFDGKKPVTVGLSDDLRKIKDMLIHPSDYQVGVSVVGMAGIGKTTLAKEVYEDPSILSHFDCRVWITIGPKYQLKEIQQAIVGQVNVGVDFDIDMFCWHVKKTLKDRRCLIVLDDIWDTHIFSYLKSCCPDQVIGSQFLVTTPLRDLLFHFRFQVHEMQLLNKEESWCLLRQKVFGEESCPFKLEKDGKKIAEKCEGLPLAIVTVADLLSKESKTPDYWNQIAEEEENSVFNNAYDRMSSKLIRNYYYLPRHLKPCFLYLGVFSKKYVIPRSKLIRLWNAEGFIEQITEQAVTFLEELVARSVVIVFQQSSFQTIKTCKLHSVFWHLCNSTAKKNKFFHVLSRDADLEGVESARRISVRNSVLFRIKNIYDSIAAISTPRSVLYTGPHYQYSIQICSAWRLLRVLDAHSIRFYQFPIEVLILVRMRYFAITYNGKLPPSISKLQNLEYLIVHRHLSITSSEDPSYLPVEIWEMKELKHLQVTGSDLPDPCGAQLPKLLTLLDVSDRSCTRRVLESIPRLKKLGVRIELAPNNAAVAPSCCFDISYLEKLRSFKCVIINPELNVKAVVPPISLPRVLDKLTLSGFGYPWSIIKSFPNLRVLKLRSYAVCWPTWEAFEEELEDIVEHLLLEDIDVEHLDGISSRFPHLKRLIIRHCYGLKEIPSEIEHMNYLKLVELVDCSPAVVDSAENIIRKQIENLEVRIHSSWK